MKVNNFKRINTADFADEDQELIEKLSFVLTPFLEQVEQAFAKNIDFDNLNQHYTFFTVRQSGGRPEVKTQVKYPLKTRIKGINVIRVENLTDGSPLTQTPFINWTMEGDLLTITSIAGIEDGKQYRFSIIMIG